MTFEVLYCLPIVSYFIVINYIYFIKILTQNKEIIKLDELKLNTSMKIKFPNTVFIGI